MHIFRIDEMASRTSSELGDVLCKKLSITKLPNSFKLQDDGSYLAEIRSTYMNNKLWDALKASNWRYIDFYTDDRNWGRAVYCYKNGKTPEEEYSNSKYIINNVKPIYKQIVGIYGGLKPKVKNAILGCDWAYISPDNGIVVSSFGYKKYIEFTGIKTYNVSMDKVDKMKEKEKSLRLKSTRKDRMFNSIKNVLKNIMSEEKMSETFYDAYNKFNSKGCVYKLLKPYNYSLLFADRIYENNAYVIEIYRNKKEKNNIIVDHSTKFLSYLFNGWIPDKNNHTYKCKTMKARIMADYPDNTYLYIMLCANEDYVIKKIEKYNPSKQEINEIKKNAFFGL